jgi:hypothetical protein
LDKEIDMRLSRNGLFFVFCFFSFPSRLIFSCRLELSSNVPGYVLIGNFHHTSLWLQHLQTNVIPKTWKSLIGRVMDTFLARQFKQLSQVIRSQSNKDLELYVTNHFDCRDKPINVKLELKIPPRSPSWLKAGMSYFNTVSLESKQTKSTVQVNFTTAKGWELRSLTQKKKGDVIVVEPAFLAVTVSKNECHHCTRSLTSKVCCRNNCCSSFVMFCSSDCEEKAWDQYHSVLCGYDYVTHCENILKHAKSTSAKISLLLLKFYAQQEKLSLLTTTTRSIFDVEPYCYFYNGAQHTSELLINMLHMIMSKLENIMRISSRKGKPLSLAIDYQWVARALLLMTPNCFAIGAPVSNNDLGGSSLYLAHLATLINHDDVPNCKFTKDVATGFLLITATQDIQKDEPLSLCYQENRQILQLVYGIK